MANNNNKIVLTSNSSSGVIGDPSQYYVINPVPDNDTATDQLYSDYVNMLLTTDLNETVIK